MNFYLILQKKPININDWGLGIKTNPKSLIHILQSLNIKIYYFLLIKFCLKNMLLINDNKSNKS